MQSFALGDFLTRWGGAARHDLSGSECEPLSLGALLDLADATDRRRWDTLSLGYGDPRGAPWLREAIATTYDTVTPAQLLCCAGAQEALTCVARAVLDSGDHAIVVVPCYPATELTVGAAADVSGIALDPARGWQLDLDRLEAAIRPRTRLVAVNFPNNPTGALPSRASFDALIALCRRHGLWLVNDEVYRLMDRDPSQRLPQVVDVYERGISINALSKSLGLPGLRVGWVACRDAARLAHMQVVKSTLSGLLAAPSELLAHVALRARDRILGRNRARAEANLAQLRTFFQRNATLFTWDQPAGGVTAFPRYHGSEGVDTFAETLVREAGVMVLPASVWRSTLAPTPMDRFRIGFGRDGVGLALAEWQALLTQAPLLAAG